MAISLRGELGNGHCLTPFTNTDIWAPLRLAQWLTQYLMLRWSEEKEIETCKGTTITWKSVSTDDMYIDKRIILSEFCKKSSIRFT